MWALGLLALAALAKAGSVQNTVAPVEVETLYIVEYTEVCVCPTQTSTALPSPAITTLVCCDSCAPVTVTESAQPITSCNTAFTKTTAVCETTGVVRLGEQFYPCNSPPCVIEYQAPCSTCYVCPYSDCWVPNNMQPKHVTVYEYFGGYDNEIGCWEENWTPYVSHLRNESDSRHAKKQLLLQPGVPSPRSLSKTTSRSTSPLQRCSRTLKPAPLPQRKHQPSLKQR